MSDETTVVHIESDGFDENDEQCVYIGRGGTVAGGTPDGISGNHSMENTPVGARGWIGNPYPEAEYGRERCITLFERDFHERIENDEEFRRAVESLQGKKLGCYCAPEDCHGDVILEYLNGNDAGARSRFAERLEGAGVSTERFIPVQDGEKGTRMKGHQKPENWLSADSPRVTGNYGIHPGGTDDCELWLVEFDIDDYDGETDREVLDALPETLTVESPHTMPDDPGHRYYAVPAEDVGVLEELAGTLNPEPSWGEIKAKGKYVVGPGSQLDDCNKDWCDECAKPDGGWYRIAEDREIATLTREQLEEILRSDPDIDTEDEETPTASDLFGYDDADGDDTNHERAGTKDDYNGPELSEGEVADALQNVPNRLSYTEWINLGFAVHAWDDGAVGKRLFQKRSEDDPKWDAERGQRHIDDIWKNGDKDGDVGVGTLVQYARDGGWDGPYGATTGNGSVSPIRPQKAGEKTDTRLSPMAVFTQAWPKRSLDAEDDPAAELGELTDRKAAAHVWALIKKDPDYHVRVRRDNAALWACDDGIWKPDGERALRQAARQALNPINYGQNVLAELKAQARSDPAAEIDRDELGLKPGFVAVKNGLLDLDAEETAELTPGDHALTRLPTTHDPDAPYDKWQALVEEWAEEGMADALQEYVGYCLHVGALPIHRALLLVGSGSNGKGVFLTVVRALLGEENTTSIELQTLANERDAVAEFYGSLANIDDDLSARKLGQGLGMFKKLTAGDRVRARRLYEDGFEFKATGKHLYAANEVPDVSGDIPEEDEAFWRRWLLVEFPNHYSLAERDPDLADTLTEPDVLSGVLNWAIEGRRRLLDQGHFTNEEQFAQAKRERWQAWGDSVEKFISNCVERDPEADNISTTQAHRRFAAWCRENNEKPIGQQKLTATLKQEPVDYSTSVRVDGKVRRGYKALGLTDAVPDLEETPERGHQSQLP